ncbi:DUF4192 domain-containing protein [Nocardioides sp.]|uniref:DUF4192 domain-containing protein n=1 Tax=Nocardioides sp. TaxID=35761 RepID=UPI003D0A58C2
MTTRDHQPPTMTARTPEDLLAVVPVVLGFHPEDSIVMLTFGSPSGSFHARVDLPPRFSVGAAVAPLLAASQRNRVDRAAFVIYSCDEPLGVFTAAQIRRAFRGAGIDVITVLRADGARWFEIDPRINPGKGRSYDVSAHRFAAQAVFDGTVTHRSRADLAASLVPVPDQVAEVASHLPAILSQLGSVQVSAEAAWAAETVAAAVRRTAGPAVRADVVARLAVALVDDHARDRVLLTLRRSNASGHARLWSEVLRRVPEEFVVAPAGLLAVAAWQSGQGALAWCAVDRCLEIEPEDGVAACVAGLLEHAVPPNAWEAWLTGPSSSTPGPDAG